MRRRLELSEKLRRILGSTHVYFQPPSNTTMEYPCFVYHLEEPDVSYADNGAYRVTDKYFIQYITDDPDDTKQEDMLTSIVDL